MMRFKILGIIILLAAGLTARAGVFSESDNFPVPPANKNMMFYLQRTSNANTIIYELNYTRNGVLDPRQPLKPYWIRYTEPGRKKKELSYIQNKLAYGVKCSKTGTDEWNIVFTAYKKIKLTLKKGTDGAYNVFTNINGKTSILDKVYIKIDGGTLMSPHIPYIELFGRDPVSKKKVYQKIIPDRS